ncbi:MAG: GH116 family glycosyl-hydrolase [Armatimonadota bacterium]|nr:GH116 family glycosyl-hydrolase [Armatimonadota bacterium]
MAKIPYSKDNLFGRGPQREFTGEKLKEIAFPLGGIGTGTISLGGRGNLRDWEMFNRPAKGKNPPYTFIAIWAKKAGAEPVAKILESQLQPSFAIGAGMPPQMMCGLPRLKNAKFRGEYPLAWIDFDDPDLPVDVSLSAFNPFIPQNGKDSGLPVAILRYTVKNKTNEPVDASIAFSIANVIGYDGAGPMRTEADYLGQNVNEFVEDKGFRGLKLISKKTPDAEPRQGSMALVTTCPDVDVLPAWERTGWWDGMRLFWTDFSSDGRLTDNGVHNPSPDGKSDVGSLCARVSLKPGESKDITFLLTWYFPHRGADGHTVGVLHNWYYTQFASAWDVAKYTINNLDRLEKETCLFHDNLFSSTLPAVVLDAASANMSIMRTTTCFRTDDGRFFGYEGCGDDRGCCPMNCTHVWNYEQAVAFLFPEFERSMRLTDYETNVFDDGKMAFRTNLPLGRELWKFHAAADGQMGCILKLYREWQLSGDDEFLKKLYPKAKKTLEYAWKEWDKDRDGVMEAIQHNTYDIEFLGPNTMMGSLYLAALKAMAIIASELGDMEAATQYREVYDKGRVNHDKALWNGEFFVQKYDTDKVSKYKSGEEGENQSWHHSAIQPGKTPKYQFGEGCLSDQMLGQWFAHVAQLGYVLLEPHVKKAMESVFKYNWLSDLSNHYNCQRTYALNDEAGLILCSWPNGGQPALPFVYSDEVWTGIEYQVAAHLIYEGMVKEGLAVVKGVRDRHDGLRRNPWNEFECGHHYARAMSSWSLILALSGYHYSAPENRIGFQPRVNAEDFRVFFSTGSGWGQYSQKLKVEGLGLREGNSALDTEIDIAYGKLSIRTITLSWPEGKSPANPKVKAAIDGKSLNAQITADGGALTVTLPKTDITPSAPLRILVTG